MLRTLLPVLLQYVHAGYGTYTAHVLLLHALVLLVLPNAASPVYSENKKHIVASVLVCRLVQTVNYASVLAVNIDIVTVMWSYC
jgi:hypothetical protein